MLVTKVPLTSVVTKEKLYRAWACGSHQWVLWVLVCRTVVSNVVSKEGPAAHAPARVFGAVRPRARSQIKIKLLATPKQSTAPANRFPSNFLRWV